MTPQRAQGRSKVKINAALAASLHAVAALWIWLTWDPGLRTTWLVYLDFPFSLLWLQVSGGLLLLFSLTAGSLWWAMVAAGLSWLVARILAKE